MDESCLCLLYSVVFWIQYVTLEYELPYYVIYRICLAGRYDHVSICFTRVQKSGLPSFSFFGISNLHITQLFPLGMTHTDHGITFQEIRH